MKEQIFESTKKFFYPENTIAKELIEKAKDLDELKTLILKHNMGLQGSSQYFDANMLIMSIDRYLQDGDIRHLTSAGNFRFTVIRLKRK